MTHSKGVSILLKRYMSKWQVAVYRNTCTADWSNQCLIFHVNHKDDWISTLHLVTFPEMKFLKPLHVSVHFWQLQLLQTFKLNCTKFSTLETRRLFLLFFKALLKVNAVSLLKLLVSHKPRSGKVYFAFVNCPHSYCCRV